MSVKLQEFASGKAVSIAKRVYTLLSKYQSVKFDPDCKIYPYKNKWGKFIGIQAKGNDGKFYQLNFSTGKTDEIVSFDIWAPGVPPVAPGCKHIPPAWTLSLEGNGITRCITAMVGFVEDPAQEFRVARTLSEDKAEEDAAIRQFFDDNPSYFDDLVSGKLDADPPWAKKVFQDFAKVRPPQLKVALVNTNAMLRVGKRAFGLTKKGNPQPLPLQGQAGGPQTTEINYWDVIPNGAKLQADFDALDRPKGALGTLHQFKEAILDMYNTPSLGANMLIASGRGGIGKSYTV